MKGFYDMGKGPIKKPEEIRKVINQMWFHKTCMKNYVYMWGHEQWEELQARLQFIRTLIHVRCHLKEFEVRIETIDIFKKGVISIEITLKRPFARREYFTGRGTYILYVQNTLEYVKNVQWMFTVMI